MGFQVGDSVVVRPGVIDPDFSCEIEGWQGRIEEMCDENLVLIRWDGVTLRQMGIDLIIRSEKDGLDWELMVLEEGEIETALPRDSEEDVRSAVNLLKAKLKRDGGIESCGR